MDKTLVALAPDDRTAGDFPPIVLAPDDRTYDAGSRSRFPLQVAIITLLFQFKPDPLVVIQERLYFMTQKPIVLVTGSSTGFGRLIVETVAKSGARVFASMRDVDGRNRPAADELRQLAEQAKLDLVPIDMDVTSEASVEQAIGTIVAETGRIDVLVNNAGVGMIGITEACSVEHIQRVFDANVFGTLRATYAVLPHMRKQHSGLLIYLGSAQGEMIVPFMSVYGATKVAVETLAEGIHYDVYSEGIDTVILHLGAYKTNFGPNTHQGTRADIWNEYGISGQVARGLADSLTAIMDGMGDPQQVADQVAELIAQPQGQRPLRVTMGMYTEGLAEFNGPKEAMQREYVEQLGFGMLLQRPETAG
jgi:NAD(P)-dependent dehydrogenase (short-subunit alcohol dehydrogenase family)